MTERAENTKRENIYLRKDGRWEARYIKERSPEGRAVYGSVYGRTREAAFQKRMEVVNLLNAQTKKWEKQSGWNINGENPGIRFSQVAEAWFEEILPGIKESTAAKYKNMLYRYILPALGDRNIAAIDTEEIQHFCVQLLQSGGKSGKGLSEKTVADILSLIRGILRYAAAKGQSGVPDLSGVHIRQPKKQMRIFVHGKP
ncbi:MAG: phage integrase central domain-containing protein [Oscillospiraceae bacterium]